MDIKPRSQIQQSSYESHGCLSVDRKGSTLYQDGAVQSKTPSTFPSNMDIPGQTQIFKQLTELIRPFLFARASQLGLRSTSILIKGPRGSGKTSLIQTVSKLLGIHLIKVNCYDLLG